MKISLERKATVAKDCVMVEPDGTVFLSFMRSGFIRAVSRTKYASGDAASSGAFGVSSAKPTEGEESSALHALTFVSEASGEEKIVILERFHSVEDAMAAWTMVHSALRRHVSGKRRKAMWRSFVRNVGLPFLVLAVGMSAVRYLDSHNGSLEALNAIMREAGTLGGTSQSAAPQIAQPSQPVSNMSAGTSGSPGQNAPGAQLDSAIHFGLDNQPPEKTLYVYSDPNCPACKRFESHVDDLAKDFSVYILPVAYQGNDDGWAAAYSLCMDDRRGAWQSVITGSPNLKRSDMLCSDGYRKTKENMAQFEKLGFTSTPRVVGGTGFVFPEGAPAKLIRLLAAEK
ncbi:thioredoxin fold domain-containing protein [Paraburkholderia hospita]|uniref:thioredoxin fold domain-containing protein n=1 Tax=Paraburkholderia hospita TaxID=169430 RepID=UPI0008A7310D|nr:thioredoxin fold domain-containing protein [Paraburkholderia hospita]SEI14383.1 Protein-disulfide isomerase [Paraburkholderia hospita]